MNNIKITPVLCFVLVICPLLFLAGCGGLLSPATNGDTATGPMNPGPVYPLPQDLIWYVAAGGTDSGTGTDSSQPLASVSAALSRIQSLYRRGKWPAGKSAVIEISGTIRGSGSFGSNLSMVDISGAGKYPPIVLRGDPLRGGVLDANRTSSNEGRALYIANNKVTLGDKLTLKGGYTVWGGAVCVGTAGLPSEGEFIMAGGEISGNTAELGGAVMVYKGHMTMTGGIIRDNVNADYSNAIGFGGGVYLNEYTSLTMSDGTISGNGGAKTENGGGVLVEGRALFTMTGGNILNNTSTANGGGVHITPYGEFTMSGGTIGGNASAAGGGVSVSPYGAKFTQTGGTISGNTPDEVQKLPGRRRVLPFV
jgi:hypothetical protein